MTEKSDFLSFLPLLKKYLLLKHPRKILEWGLGFSTFTMLQSAPNAEIWSLEHDPQWFVFWVTNEHETHFPEFPPLAKFPNVHVYRLDLHGNYAAAPYSFGVKFDLVMVDGEDNSRVECLKTAYDLLADGGVVFLHDSGRAYYAEAKARFRVVEEMDETAVLQK